MPYIAKEKRENLDAGIDVLKLKLLGTNFEKGDLNYCITKLVLAYIESKGLSYSNLSDITGVLNDVKTEFERRVVAKYEDQKIKENGDVY